MWARLFLFTVIISLPSETWGGSLPPRLKNGRFTSRNCALVLQGLRQPKYEMSVTAEKAGILVPRRFTTLAEAMSSGKAFIIRSEHPEELAGAAGLLKSYIVGADGKLSVPMNTSEADQVLVAKYLQASNEASLTRKLNEFSNYFWRGYANRMGIDHKAFESQISYSYWEMLGGYNQSIIADSAIKGRYHVFTSRATSSNDSSRMDQDHYIVVENGTVLLGDLSSFPSNLPAQFDDVISFYEKVRNLPGVDPSHVPLVEFQTFEGKNYFLQYHRTRNFEESTYVLSRDPEEGEFVADFVRGATTPEGIIVDAAVSYPYKNRKINYPTPSHESASFDFHHDVVFTEIMTRHRDAQVIAKSWRDLSSTGDSHLQKSVRFNPSVSIAFPMNKIVPDSELREHSQKWYQIAKETQKPVRIKLRIVSDGRRAYIKVLDLPVK
ncbi:MAG: hypothetical protein CL678_08205 [Bdellovibrionaceae bacterium]|nr:hypothetical protein [Pseudobdellovibrionaceae bacterium]